MACGICGGSTTPDLRLPGPPSVEGLPACQLCAGPLVQLTNGTLDEAGYSRYLRYLESNAAPRIQRGVQAMWQAAGAGQAGPSPAELEAERIMVTSSHQLQGYRIYNYLGFVSEEATVRSTQVFPSDEGLLAELGIGKRVAMKRARRAAASVHANALIGVQIQYVKMSDIFTVVAVSGTAVLAEPTDD